MHEKLNENGLSFKLLKRRQYSEMNSNDFKQKELPKLPETGKIELELSNTLDDLYNNFYQQFMDQVQPKKLIEFLKTITVPLNNLTSPPPGTSVNKEAQKRSSPNRRQINKQAAPRVEFLSPPMPPQVVIPSQVEEAVDFNDLNNVKDSIENKLSKLSTYGNQYRNFALEFLSQYLNLLSEFGMQFRDLGLGVVKSIGVDADPSKNNDKIIFN